MVDGLQFLYITFLDLGTSFLLEEIKMVELLEKNCNLFFQYKSNLL